MRFPKDSQTEQGRFFHIYQLSHFSEPQSANNAVQPHISTAPPKTKTAGFHVTHSPSPLV